MTYTYSDQHEVNVILNDFIYTKAKEFDPIKASVLLDFVLNKACLSPCSSCIQMTDFGKNKPKNKVLGYACGIGDVQIELDDDKLNNRLQKNDEIWVDYWTLSYALRSNFYILYIQDKLNSVVFNFDEAKSMRLPVLYCLAFDMEKKPVEFSKAEYTLKPPVFPLFSKFIGSGPTVIMNFYIYKRPALTNPELPNKTCPSL